MIVPVPKPPPQHMLINPSFPFDRCSSCTVFVINNGPVDPSACPIAIALHWDLRGHLFQFPFLSPMPEPQRRKPH